MAHQADSNVIETVVQLLSENGLSHMADAMRLILNEAMRIERSQALDAEPYQRTQKRRGYANGFKPKTVSTRLGELSLQVPQVRGGVEFYPSALERGVRSERALPPNAAAWVSYPLDKPPLVLRSWASAPLPKCMCRAFLRAR